MEYLHGKAALAVLITLTRTLITLDITKTESSHFFNYTLKEKKMVATVQITKRNKARELDMITLRNHSPRSNITVITHELECL